VGQVHLAGSIETDIAFVATASASVEIPSSITMDVSFLGTAAGNFASAGSLACAYTGTAVGTWFVFGSANTVLEFLATARGEVYLPPVPPFVVNPMIPQGPGGGLFQPAQSPYPETAMSYSGQGGSTFEPGNNFPPA
jgi:hypothetical protein